MRNRVYLLFDVVFASIVVVLSFTARYEGLAWWPALATMAVSYTLIAIPIKVVVFWFSGLYGRLWRYASIGDLEIALYGCLLGAVVSFGVGLLLLPALGLANPRVPIGVLAMDSVLTAAVVMGSRLLLRVTAWHRFGTARAVYKRPVAREGRRRVLIAGAGSAGGMIAKELLENSQLGLQPVGFLDDDATKHGHRLRGLPVLGPISALDALVHQFEIDEVIIAMPAAGGKVVREITRHSTAAGVRTRTVPGLYEILSGVRAVSALRPVQIEDLLRREPIQTNTEQVRTLVKGRTVLVTGAGGSIGAELCRQLAQLAPAKLVVLGRGENSIFSLLEELRANFRSVPVQPAIVDVRDEIRLRAVFEATQPYSVFHAAAHKHVPLMEASVDEAILNNVLGTRNVADLCGEFGVEHFVLISTDKAVRPTSIMGATKRIAEGTVCEVAQRHNKPYVSVRFGNVLGSRGSVVPTFLRQISAGGPVTITHPEMRRYFMTIPEAVQLVLQAAALGKGSEVFVLDMGEPVRIADLAEDLIRLSGLEVGNDIEIEVTGIRPGEKLYEELFFGPDDALPTAHSKILRARDTQAWHEADVTVEQLIDAAQRRAPEQELRRMMRALVPEYQPPVDGKPELSEAPILTVHSSGVSRRRRLSAP